MPRLPLATPLPMLPLIRAAFDLQEAGWTQIDGDKDELAQVHMCACIYARARARTRVYMCVCGGVWGGFVLFSWFCLNTTTATPVHGRP